MRLKKYIEHHLTKIKTGDAILKEKKKFYRQIG